MRGTPEPANLLVQSTSLRASVAAMASSLNLSGLIHFIEFKNRDLPRSADLLSPLALLDPLICPIAQCNSSGAPGPRRASRTHVTAG